MQEAARITELCGEKPLTGVASLVLSGRVVGLVLADVC